MWTKDKTSEQSAQAVTNTRVVKITKHNEPLGATVRNEGDKVVIGRIVKGGAAERSGALHPGDEVLEVNSLKLCGRSVHDICSTLCEMSGTLTFVIIPAGSNTEEEEASQPVVRQTWKKRKIYFCKTFLIETSRLVFSLMIPIPCTLAIILSQSRQQYISYLQFGPLLSS